MSIRHLDALFDPASVVLVGASDRPGSLGAAIWSALRGGGFQGTVRAVNRRGPTLADGTTALRRVADLPEPPDLALLATSPAAVPQAVAELAARGCRAAVVFSGGLDEAAQRAMFDAARPSLMRIVGPGSLGLLVPAPGLNAGAWPAPLDAAAVPPGELALVGASAGLLASVLDWSRGHGIGFSRVLALGDEADVDAADALDWLASDARSRAILLCPGRWPGGGSYGRKFMSAARAAARNKPVVVLLPGAHRAPSAWSDGDVAAAGEDDGGIQAAALRRAGLLRVQSLHALCLAAQTLLRWRDNTAEALVLAGNGAGPLSLAVAAVRDLGVPLAPPGPGVAANPLDLGEDADLVVHTAALAALAEGRSAAAAPRPAVLLLHAPSRRTDALSLAEALLPLAAPGPSHAPWLQVCWLGGPAAQAPRTRCDAAGIACYPTPEDAVGAFALQRAWRRHQVELLQTPPARPLPALADVAAVRTTADAALAAGRRVLAGDEAAALLGVAGIRLAAAPRAAPGGSAGDEAGPTPGRWRVGTARHDVFGPVLWCAPDAPGATRRWALPPLDAPLVRAWLARLHGPLGQPPAEPLATALEHLLLALSQLLADLPALVASRIDGLVLAPDGALAGHARLRLEPALGAGGGADAFAIVPYPLHWVERVDWNGTALTLRPIRPEDEPQHLDFLAAMAPEDIRLRVFYSRRSIEHSELARLTQIDYARELAFIAAAADPAGTGAEQTLGVVRAAVAPDGLSAEFGLMVRTDLKGRGLGRLLMDKLVRALRERGVQRLDGTVLAENAAMRALARGLGFSDAPVPGEGVRAISLALA